LTFTGPSTFDRPSSTDTTASSEQSNLAEVSFCNDAL
jgi:hypothetical protein